MKQNILIEKWLKKCNNKDLSLLYILIKDEKLREKLPYAAFLWTVNECKELSILNGADSRITYILKYRQSGLCIRRNNSINDFIMEINKHKGLDIYPVDHVFFSIHEYSGLCIDCIGKFLFDFINKLNLDS